jgi:fumarate hydratase class II
MIRALGILKKAAALVNEDLGKMPSDKARLIAQAADEVIAGTLDDHFPLRVWQTGSGTQTNMNANEVISNRAIEIAGGVMGSKKPIHPNDHVNLSQSSNDTFPTAMHIAAAERMNALIPEVQRLRTPSRPRRARSPTWSRSGARTCRTPRRSRSGRSFPAGPACSRATSSGSGSRCPACTIWPSAAPAVGTGLNSHPEWSERAAAKIAELTGLPFTSHPNKFAALSAHDEIVFASGALKTLAGSLMKIANDIRWLASGRARAWAN